MGVSPDLAYMVYLEGKEQLHVNGANMSVLLRSLYEWSCVFGGSPRCPFAECLDI